MLVGEFSPPTVANSYRTSCAPVKEFEEDMQEHTVLEDDVVLPRAIALEKAAVQKPEPQSP